MESRKIVKLLILLFAVLTVVFYALYYREKNQISVLSDAFVEEAVLNLNSRDITIDNSVIVREIPKEIIYVFTTDEEQKYSNTVAQAFSECFEKGVISTSLSTPSGESVSLNDSTNTEIQLGKILFSNTDFGFVYSIQGSSISPDLTPVYNENTEIETEKKQLIKKITSHLLTSSSFGYLITGSISDGTYDIISVAETFNDIEMNGVYINFVFENDMLVHAVGSWITAKPQQGHHEKLTDGINVLYKLDLDGVSKIYKERIIYSLRKGDGNKYYILPCWEISAVDKNGNAFKKYFDAV